MGSGASLPSIFREPACSRSAGFATRFSHSDVRLQVAGSNERDVGKGTARITQQAFDKMGLSQGGVIEIVGERSTAAIALPPYPEDEGLEIIRLDGLIRANANVSMGDHVTVRAADWSGRARGSGSDLP